MTIIDDSPRCGREDAIVSEHGTPVAVRCLLPKKHDGRHAYIHTWTDPRDR